MAIIVSDSNHPRYGSSVESFTITASGAGYTGAEEVTVVGGDNNCILVINSVDVSGAIVTASLKNTSSRGSSYAVTGYTLTGGSGTGASISVDNIHHGISTPTGFYRSDAYQINVKENNNFQGARTLLTFAATGACLGVVMCIQGSTVAVNTNNLIIYLEEVFTPVTITIASPGVINFTSHGLLDGQKVEFYTTGALPSGMTYNTVYYVVGATAHTFNISDTLGGPAKNLSGTQSGVHTLYAIRAEETKTYTTIHPEATAAGANGMLGMYTPIKFTSPYTIDSIAANKYAIKANSAYYFYGGTTLQGAFCVTWSDHEVPFTDNDGIVVVDELIIDKTCTIQGVSDGGANVSCVICRSLDPTEDNVSLLKWENPPFASYTFTVNGKMHLGSYSGFRVGTELNPISYANRANINMLSIITGPNGNVDAWPKHKLSLFLYGEVPTKEFGVLAQDANTGQNKIVLTEDLSSEWHTSDSLYIGKQDTLSAPGTLAYHTISSFSGTEITLGTNLATYKRISGGSVLNFSGRYGIYLYNNSAVTLQYVYGPNFCIIKGCLILNVTFALGGGGYSYYRAVSTNRKKWSITHCTYKNTSGYPPNSFVYIGGMPPEGAEMKYCYGVNGGLASGISVYINSVHRSGVFEFKYNISCLIWGFNNINNLAASSALCTMDVQYNSFENGVYGGNMPLVFLFGQYSIFKNNKLWGGYCVGPSIYGGGALVLWNCYKPDLANNTYNKCAVAIGLGGQNVIKAIERDSLFGNESANTIDIYFYGNSYVDYELNSNTGNLIIDTTYLSYLLAGSWIKITDENNTANKDSGYLAEGKIVRTGSGLSDTTVHTSGSGKFAMRFEPIGTSNLFWEYDIPIGDIQNKSMTVLCWVKINSANYYAGVHQKPKLTITYDQTSTVISTAINSTDWQILICNFTLLTTFGTITFRIEGLTDALTSNAYFYLDDIAILYPPGSQLNLGGLDLWSKGAPIIPPIATNIAAADVWNVILGSNPTGSAGQILNSLPSATGVAGSVWSEVITGYTGASAGKVLMTAKGKAQVAAINTT